MGSVDEFCTGSHSRWKTPGLLVLRLDGAKKFCSIPPEFRETRRRPMHPLTKKIHDAGLTVEAVAFVANVATEKLKNVARGRAELSVEEMARVQTAIARKPV